jgi:hypothetical protein
VTLRVLISAPLFVLSWAAAHALVTALASFHWRRGWGNRQNEIIRQK